MIRRKRSANELFPSADWRYLLPNPAPATVVADGDGPLAETAGRLVDGQVVTVDEAPGLPSTELAVAARADRATIERLASRVRPGGILYLETAWPRLRGVDVVARRLTDAGLRDPVLYSLSPSNDRWSGSWWVPIGHQPSFRLVAGTNGRAQPGSLSRLDRLRASATRLVLARPGLASRHPWILWPNRRRILCVVAAKPGDDGGDGPTTQPGILPRPEAPFVGLRSATMRVGGSSTDQAMLFGFGDSQEPDLVVKAPTRSEEVAATGHEAGVLTMLTDRPDPMPGVPRPVPLPTRPAAAGVAAWGQSFEPGSSLADIVGPNTIDRHADAMVGWLIELASRTEARPRETRIGSTAVGELDPLWRQLPDGESLRAATALALDELRLTMAVCQHRDLGPWNALVDGDTLRVIDWADADPVGYPLCDLHHFLVHLGLCALDAYGLDRRRAVIGQLLDDRTELGRLVNGCLQRYASAFGLDDAQVLALRVLTWLLDLLRRPLGDQIGSIYLDLLRAELRSLQEGE